MDDREALIEADGCFEAALAEGWIEALASGDIDTIRDIWNRRISHARIPIAGTLAHAPETPETDLDPAEVWEDYLEEVPQEEDRSLQGALAFGFWAAFNAVSQSPSTAMSSKALADIASERQRQISVEGWSTQHDDEHEGGQLAAAAGVYALVASERHNNIAKQFWPWDFQWWKPCDARRNLIKAGALIAAEIERLDRADALSRPRNEGNSTFDGRMLHEQYDGNGRPKHPGGAS